MTLEAAIACTRFGLGAGKGEILAASKGARDWLAGQLTRASPSAFPSQGLASSSELIRDFRQISRRILTARKSGGDLEAIQKQRGILVRNAVQADLGARLRYGAETRHSFHERLTRFWSNHFTVSSTNNQARIIVAAHEREAIRPFILGRFNELAERAILHQAMLIYLDNVQSIGPGSQAGERRNKGLNENLAREVMELHTLTPGSGYTQSDVTEFAKALTGWTTARRQNRPELQGRTVFEPRMHEPGTRRILGKVYGEDGESQAKTILLDFCRHPSTAQNIAFKFARHFDADIPDGDLVARLKAVFLETDGDLTALYRTLIDSDVLWQAEQQKVKTPDELVTSTARLIGLDAAMTDRQGAVFRGLAQSPFGAPTPQGWPDIAQSWIGADSLTKRIEWANQVGRKNGHLDARRLIDEGVGPLLSMRSVQAIARAESGQEALALALLSPEFQRR